MSGPAGKKRRRRASLMALPVMGLYLLAMPVVTLGLGAVMHAFNADLDSWSFLEVAGFVGALGAPGYLFSLYWVWTAVTRLIEPDWTITWMSQKNTYIDGKAHAVDDKLRTGKVSRLHALAMIAVGLFFWLVIPGAMTLSAVFP